MTPPPYTAKDQALSETIAAEIWAVPRMCWHNARQALRGDFAELADATYVEGFFVDMTIWGLIVEHGWVERADGVVIDPTLPHDEGYYFPGVSYTRAEIVAYDADPQKDPTEPYVWGGANGLGGFSNADYRQADQASRDLARLLAEQAGG